MPSIRNIFSFGTSLLASQTTLQPESSSPFSVAISSLDNSTFPSCPVDSPLSCHNKGAEPTCCYVAPGGQFLLAQFWDTNPSIGPTDSWTLHGLWPDNCDGTYPQFCHDSPAYSNLTQIMQHFSPATLTWMSEYWLPNRGSPASFWYHEWTKHGTCINTLAPTCYDSSSYTPGLEASHYFETAVALFKKLDSYKALVEAGVYPSFERRWKRRVIENALEKVTGKKVVLGCQRGGALNEVWYGFNVKGSVQGGEFVAADPVGKSFRQRCPEEGIRWLPK